MVAEKGFGPPLVSRCEIFSAMKEILLWGFVVVQNMADFIIVASMVIRQKVTEPGSMMG